MKVIRAVLYCRCLNGATETQVSKRVRQWFTGEAFEKAENIRGVKNCSLGQFISLCYDWEMRIEKKIAHQCGRGQEEKTHIPFTCKRKHAHTPLWTVLDLLSKQRLRCWIDWDGLDKVSCWESCWRLWYSYGGWGCKMGSVIYGRCDVRLANGILWTAKDKKTEQAERRGHRGGKGLLFSVAEMQTPAH